MTRHNQPLLVGIDVGGTFTDFVVLDRAGLRVHKVATTPDDQSRAIVGGLAALGITQAEIVHGMTVATNALLERRGAATALLTTAGFADVLVIGRQNRPHLYRLSQSRPAPLVADRWRLEVPERLEATGAVLEPLDEDAVIRLADQLAAAQATGEVESLALVFLFSFRNPAHEERAAALLRARCPGLPISLSSAILPEYREFERTAATVINAYVQPLVSRYLGRLAQALAGSRVRIMQSNGGAISLDQAADQAARLVLSGPAGGVVGAFAVARAALDGAPPQLITFDMGGTSTDVALCPGEIPTTAESVITDLPLRLPIIDIHTVGAGGGSVAYLDAAGGLHVGPRSAGAVPGPASYGRGGQEATVTDANLVLGRLDPQGFLGGHGDVALDVEAARAVLTGLGARLGLSPEAAALGVIRIANATMERALRRVSVERGYDPRRFILLPFGGAGPLHACELAAALDIRRILVPPIPGVLSAYGMLAADVAYDASQTVLGAAADLAQDPAPLAAAYRSLAGRVQTVLAREGIATPHLEAALDLRYRGQSYELTVPLALPLAPATVAGAISAFHEAHARRYGYAMPDEPVEAVNLRVRGRGAGASPPLPDMPLAGADAAAARLDSRPIWFSPDGPARVPRYDRSRLQPGNRFAGPALVLQYDATVLVTPGWQARVDRRLNLWLERPDQST
ncbi:MAG TPA: hydantoinase/oxoprolinase family protein [Caldilineaceae bacterium]|nr:hydantoinase/oxoprolinase family protein [Caldilineaceae bacterium]